MITSADSRKSHPSAIWNTLELATSPTSSSSGNWSSFNSDSASIANTHFASVNSSTFFHPLLYSLLSPLFHLYPFPLPHHPWVHGVKMLLLLWNEGVLLVLILFPILPSFCCSLYHLLSFLLYPELIHCFLRLPWTLEVCLHEATSQRWWLCYSLKLLSYLTSSCSQ